MGGGAKRGFLTRFFDRQDALYDGSVRVPTVRTIHCT